MGAVRVQGKGLGAAVYEDTNPHKPIPARHLDDTAVIQNADVYGPEYWAELDEWESRQEADRAMQRAAALQNLDRDFVKPLFQRGARRRFTRARRRGIYKRARQKLYTQRQFAALDQLNRGDSGMPGEEILNQKTKRWTVYAVIAWIGSVMTVGAGFGSVMLGLISTNLVCK